MKTSTDQTVEFILQDEGAEFNRGGSEPGGGSKYGVSLTVYREVLPGATLDNLAGLTKAEAAHIYINHILPQIRFDELPVGVDYRFADIRVNLGQTGSVNLLELVLQRWPLTGKMDDGLIAAVRNTADSLVLALSAAWIAKKHESPNWGPSPQTKNGYGHGWSNRNIEATRRAIGMLLRR